PLDAARRSGHRAWAVRRHRGHDLYHRDRERRDERVSDRRWDHPRPASDPLSSGHPGGGSPAGGAVAALTPLLQTHALSKTFGGVEAVRDADFRIDRGEIRALIGPNGAGKTTLVSMICGRLTATSGRIVFQGRDITRARPDERVACGIAYTFQAS